MSCLDCSFISLNKGSLHCQHGLPIHIGELSHPEQCKKGKKEDNYIGKTYGMKTMLSLILTSQAKSLSKEEIDRLQEEISVTNQILLTIDLYEQKIEEAMIERPEEKNRKQAISCYHCTHASSTDYLFVQCGYYHNDIGERLESCHSIHNEWEKQEQMIREIGLSHFFDLVLQYNSSLWLYWNEDMTAGDKWIAILDTYEETLERKYYQVRKAKKPIKEFSLTIQEMLKKIEKRESESSPMREALEDGIVY
ncbi:hypothetical protein CVD28_01330 [Bacillus sp. M6-12]|nr:hypothetical protein CVD28_01330 [Bacillus sp. M6-12]